MEICEANLERIQVDCPRFDENIAVLGVLCRQGGKDHEWGTTGKCLRQKRKDGSAGNCLCCRRGQTVEEVIKRHRMYTQTAEERHWEQKQRSTDEEQWVDVPDYEGFYEVSSLGRVRSVINDLILKMSPSSNGYAQVVLWKGKGHKEKTILAHRLVALTFLSDSYSEDRPYVNHIDGNKRNNSVSNLEWVSAQENAIHAIEVLKISKVNSGNFQAGSQHKASKMTEDDVKWILDNQATMKRKDMAAAIGVSTALINDICLRRRWTHITSWYGLSD